MPCQLWTLAHVYYASKSNLIATHLTSCKQCHKLAPCNMLSILEQCKTRFYNSDHQSSSYLTKNSCVWALRAQSSATPHAFSSPTSQQCDTNSTVNALCLKAPPTIQLSWDDVKLATIEHIDPSQSGAHFNIHTDPGESTAVNIPLN